LAETRESSLFASDYDHVADRHGLEKTEGVDGQNIGASEDTHFMDVPKKKGANPSLGTHLYNNSSKA